MDSFALVLQSDRPMVPHSGRENADNPEPLIFARITHIFWASPCMPPIFDGLLSSLPCHLAWQVAVEVSDIYGLKWAKATASLERNRLLLERESGARTELVMDGRIVDDSEKRRHALFVVNSLFAASPTDLLLAFAAADQVPPGLRL
jgi:hypothetical protein